MMKPTRRALLASALATPALAQSWAPSRPVLVIVPYAAGNAGDVALRIVQERLEARLGQRVLVDARPGAGGNIGAAAVARAEPDGHTLLLGATNNFAVNQYLFRGMGFDPLTAFEPVTRLVDIPCVMFAPAAMPVRNLAEWIAEARRAPGRLNFASPSPGTTLHLAGERLAQLAGINIVHVPYRGSPLAIAALMAGEVHLFIGGYASGREGVETGRLRLLAAATERRLAALPDLPTAIEQGVAGFVASNWWGIAAPRGTPRAVVAALHAAFADALSYAPAASRLTATGQVPGGEPPEAFAALIREEALVWRETIQRGNISIE